MTAFAIARANMVESQLRPNGVTDRRILGAMARLPRELFVPEAQRVLAYMDQDIMIAPGREGGSHRYLLAPMTLARLIQLTEIRPADTVLHLGCGTGYACAILAELGGSTFSIEPDPLLAEMVQANLMALGLGNVTVVQAPLIGDRDGRRFDAIVVEGRMAKLPDPLLHQLSEEGRLVAVIGRQPVGQAVLAVRRGESFSARTAFDAAAPELPGLAEPRPAFVF